VEENHCTGYRGLWSGDEISRGGLDGRLQFEENAAVLDETRAIRAQEFLDVEGNAIM
jgi:hypothetical protein